MRTDVSAILAQGHLPEPGGREDTPFEKTYRGIIQGIYEGSLIPGQRLVAPDLMQRFGVGRGTIREVLHRLASLGIVSIVPNRGAAVRHLTRKEVNDVLDVVEVLLGLAAREAAPHMRDRDTREEFDKLFRQLTLTSQNQNFPEFLSARERFYRFIVRRAGNKELARLFPDAQTHIMRVQLRTFGKVADAIEPGDYDDLAQALLDANPTSAEAAGREHVQNTRNRIALLPDAAFSPDQRYQSRR